LRTDLAVIRTPVGPFVTCWTLKRSFNSDESRVSSAVLMHFQVAP